MAGDGARPEGLGNHVLESRESTGDAGFRRPNQNPMVEEKEAAWPNDLREPGSGLERKR